MPQNSRLSQFDKNTTDNKTTMVKAEENSDIMSNFKKLNYSF